VTPIAVITTTNMPHPELPPVIADLRPWLAAIARRIAGNAADADDLVAAALLGLWKDRDVVLTCADPVPMAKVIGKRAMLYERRRQRRHLRTVVAADGTFDILHGREPEPIDVLDEFDTLVSLARVQDADLLRRRFRDGLLLDDLAAAAGVTRAAVRERIERATAVILDRLHT
jgi:DNA-directed RNA polymerase specialized sigma24 family protein